MSKQISEGQELFKKLSDDLTQTYGDRVTALNDRIKQDASSFGLVKNYFGDKGLRDEATAVHHDKINRVRNALSYIGTNGYAANLVKEAGQYASDASKDQALSPKERYERMNQAASAISKVVGALTVSTDSPHESPAPFVNRWANAWYGAREVDKLSFSHSKADMRSELKDYKGEARTNVGIGEEQFQTAIKAAGEKFRAEKH